MDAMPRCQHLLAPRRQDQNSTRPLPPPRTQALSARMLGESQEQEQKSSRPICPSEYVAQPGSPPLRTSCSFSPPEVGLQEEALEESVLVLSGLRLVGMAPANAQLLLKDMSRLWCRGQRERIKIYFTCVQ